MLSGRPSLPLGLQQLEIVDEHLPRLARLYHVIQVGPFCRHVRVREFLTLRLDEFLPLGCGILGLGKLVPEDDVDRSLRTHYSDLGRWPSKVGIGTDVLAAQDIVGSTVGLADNYRNLGDGGLAVGVEEFGAVADYSVMLLVDSGEEAGHINEGEDWDVEGVAEPYESCSLDGRVYVDHTRVEFRLVRDYSYGLAVDPRERRYHVRSPERLHLKQLSTVDYPCQNLFHIVRLVIVVRQDRIQLFLSPSR